MEIKLPISTLPLLDSDPDGELLDESFETCFYTRQSGGVGNDNDTGGNGISPTAVTLGAFSVRMNTEIKVVDFVFAVSILILAAVVLGSRAHLFRRGVH